jgi:hypothetical protein
MAMLSIHLTQELQRRLEVAAAKRSLPTGDFVLATLEQAVQPELQPAEEKPFWATATPQERAEDFERWAKTHRHGVGLPDEALRRENMYGEH